MRIRRGKTTAVNVDPLASPRSGPLKRGLSFGPFFPGVRRRGRSYREQEGVAEVQGILLDTLTRSDAV